MEKKFEINFFELMFLSESIIPEMPIARYTAFEDLSEKHYHKMSNEERNQFFKHVIKQYGFDLENEQCRHFYARFNPENQYTITCFYNGKPQEVKAYRFEDRYHTSRNRFINKEHITKIIWDRNGEEIKNFYYEES